MKFTVFLFIIIMATGCKNREPKTHNDIKLLEINVTQSDLPKFMDQIKVIDICQLETNQNILLGSVRKVTCRFDRYFIQDLQTQSLNVFNLEGKFLTKIGRKGKGPGEFTELRDFSITNDSIVHVLTYQKIVKYDIKGKLIDEIKISHINHLNPLHLATDDGKTYFLWQGTFSDDSDRKYMPCLLYSFDLNGKKVKNQYFPIKRTIVDGIQFNNCSNGIILRPTFGSNTIYKIVGDSLFDSFTVDFGKDQLDENLLENGFGNNVIRQYMNLRSNSKYCVGIDNVLETEKYYYFTFFYDKRMKQLIYSKNTRNYCIDNVNPFTYMICTNNNQLVSLIEPINFSMLKEFFSKGKITEESYSKLEKIKVDKSSNPILIVYEINRF
ncbi:6-bladed beta-propeller [Saccharicrinis sp. FJH2]|uniref:6-bladed beta-propeller n=1 Tax=Saccharicrinis sp. FJH65 TaxID=3344659 RepID=UPI0035F40A77